MTSWLLFNYKVPNDPSASRVYVWRKLKTLGAILLHDAVWVLPDLAPTREKLQWLTMEIRDMDGGEATLWRAEQLLADTAADLVQKFREQADVAYREILEGLERPDANLTTLARRYRQIAQQDYFAAAAGEQVRQRLIERRGSE
ncbi:MAG: ChrB protein [Anaerolineae bacterium]|nr:ChrB protein [Anaerolineae bacterium]